MDHDRPVVRRASDPFVSTRRPGISERRRWLPTECREQNVVEIEATRGARVEEHVVANSESFFLVEGRLRIFGPGFEEQLGPGDFCGFAAGMAHGVEALEDSRYLVVFAPAGAGR